MTNEKITTSSDHSRRTIIKAFGAALTGVAGFSGLATADNHQQNRPQVDIHGIGRNSNVSVATIWARVSNVKGDLERMLTPRNVRVFFDGTEVAVTDLTIIPRGFTNLGIHLENMTIPDMEENDVIMTVTLLGDEDTAIL